MSSVEGLTARPLSPEEAAARVARLYDRVYRRWDERVTKGPFMSALLEGSLSMEAIRLFWKNWYYFVSEINNFHGIAFQRFLGFLKHYPDLYAAYADKVADELIHPAPPGHITIVLEQGKVFGLREEEMIHCQMLPECRAYTEWFRGLVYEGTLAEWWACHTVEEQIGHWSRQFRQAIVRNYGIPEEQTRYFQVHEEADLQEHEGGVMGHGQLNRLALQRVFESGQVFMRPGFTFEYVADMSVDYQALFFEGILKHAR